MKRPSYFQQIAPRTQGRHDATMLVPPRLAFRPEVAKAEFLELDRGSAAPSGQRSPAARPVAPQQPYSALGSWQQDSAAPAAVVSLARRERRPSTTSGLAPAARSSAATANERSQSRHDATVQAATSRTADQPPRAVAEPQPSTSRAAAVPRIAGASLRTSSSEPNPARPPETVGATRRREAMAVTAAKPVHPPITMSEPVIRVPGAPAAGQASGFGAPATVAAAAAHRPPSGDARDASPAPVRATTTQSASVVPAPALPVVAPPVPRQPAPAAAREPAASGLHIGTLEVRVVSPAAPPAPAAAPRAAVRPTATRAARVGAGRIARGFAVFGLGQS